MVDRTYDLRTRSAWANVLDVFDAIIAPKGRTIRVISAARFGGGNSIEIVFNETPLKAAIWTFCINIILLSIIISVITAALVYLSLNWLLVRPMRALTGNMVRFGQAPEDASRIIKPSGRRDEIGTAEVELSHLQSELGQMLQQKSRLAALGLAVSKISHDLRNILAHAQLVSDRLGQVEDPTVKRVAPKLIGSLDRAIDLCVNTLKYGKAKERTPERSRFALLPLVEEVLETLDPPSHKRIAFHNAVTRDLEIDADREQLFRIILNLTRNAVQALESDETREGKGQIVISGSRRGAVFYLTIEDDGPGIAQAAQTHLFEAFQSSTRKGGSGLGLAISAELVQAHGGTLELADSEHGAKFVISIPDRIARLPSARERRTPKTEQKRAP
jgi:signal transduction histidine kinase